MTAIATNEAPIIAAAAVEDGQHIFASTENQYGRGSIDVGKRASEVDVQPEHHNETSSISAGSLARFRGQHIRSRLSSSVSGSRTMALPSFVSRFSTHAQRASNGH